MRCNECLAEHRLPTKCLQEHWWAQSATAENGWKGCSKKGSTHGYNSIKDPYNPAGFLFTINSKQSWVSHRCAGHLGYWDAAGDVAGRVRDTRFPLFRYTPWGAREGSKMGGWNRRGGVDGPKFGQKTILPEINSESTIYQCLRIGKSSNHPQSKPSWEMLCWFRGG